MGDSVKQTNALFKAVGNNDLGGVKEAFEQKHNGFTNFTHHPASVNTRNSDGYTPLILAINRGDRDIIRFLISQRADVNMKDSRGNAPVVHAARSGMKDVINELLASKAKIDEPNNTGWNALMEACQHRQSETVTLLIAKKHAVNEKAHNGTTALMMAAQSRDTLSVNALLDAGADIDARDNNGKSALFYAVHHGALNTFEDLLKRGARLDFQDTDFKKVEDYSTNDPFKKILEKYKMLQRQQKLSEVEGAVHQVVAAPAVLEAPTLVEPEVKSMQERIARVMEDEGLDPAQSKHWVPVGDEAIEHVLCSTRSPKMLTNTFNFAAKQYTTTSKNILTNTKDIVTGNLEDFPNQDLVMEGHAKLKELGSTPPEYIPPTKRPLRDPVL